MSDLQSQQTDAIQVSNYPPYPALLMRWSPAPTGKEVRAAFKIINDLLSESPNRLYVVVDIRCNPRFPMFDTIQGALTGPYRNSKLIEWLIIGRNSLAQMIESTLSYTTQRRNVRWFEDEAAVQSYLNERTTA